MIRLNGIHANLSNPLLGVERVKDTKPTIERTVEQVRPHREAGYGRWLASGQEEEHSPDEVDYEQHGWERLAGER
jgi:hypothetical protein